MTALTRRLFAIAEAIWRQPLEPIAPPPADPDYEPWLEAEPHPAPHEPRVLPMRHSSR